MQINYRNRNNHFPLYAILAASWTLNPDNVPPFFIDDSGAECHAD